MRVVPDKLRKSLLGTTDHLDPASTLPAYTKVLDFVTVCTHMDVSTLRIKAAVILKGALQCGKCTTVRKVAQALGLHVCEVSKYLVQSMPSVAHRIAFTLD